MCNTNPMITYTIYSYMIQDYIIIATYTTYTSAYMIKYGICQKYFLKRNVYMFSSTKIHVRSACNTAYTCKCTTFMLCILCIYISFCILCTCIYILLNIVYMFPYIYSCRVGCHCVYALPWFQSTYITYIHDIYC